MFIRTTLYLSFFGGGQSLIKYKCNSRSNFMLRSCILYCMGHDEFFNGQARNKQMYFEPSCINRCLLALVMLTHATDNVKIIHENIGLLMQIKA